MLDKFDFSGTFCFVIFTAILYVSFCVDFNVGMSISVAAIVYSITS